MFKEFGVVVIPLAYSSVLQLLFSVVKERKMSGYGISSAVSLVCSSLQLKTSHHSSGLFQSDLM